MNLPVRLALGSLVIACGFLGAAHGCSSSSSGVAVQDAATLDAGSLFDVYASDAPHCVIPPKPPQVPDGWDLYTDYDPCCLLYTPKAPQYLPPPLQWTACNAAWAGDGGIDGGDCRQIDQPVAGSPEFGASVQDGVVSLATGEFVNGLYADVIAEADGPVHQALLETDRKTSRCTPFPQDMRDGKYVYAMYPPSDFNGGGFLAGDVNEFRPSFLHHFSDDLTHGVVAGKLGVLDVDETDTFNLYEWSATPKVVRNPQDDGLDDSFAFFSGNALFWSASSGSFNRMVVYTDDAGAVDLLSSGSDPSYGYDDLGTDGTDMVWMRGNGHDAGPVGFDSATLMASPFALTAAGITPKRLRSESTKRYGVSPIRVGCGYAVRTNGDYLRIVRISDGVSWVLSSTTSWSWLHPLAVTCDEVFAAVSASADTNNIARVRISSLGPGIPAD